MDTQKAEKFKEIVGSQRVKENEPMSQHTTIKIGGPADLYFEAETTEDLARAVKAAKQVSLPFFVFGAGSNILVADKGIRGVVIRNKTKNIKIAGFKGTFSGKERRMDEMYVETDSGIAVNYLVRFTIEEGLEGLEVFLGLPGTVGGAIWNNSHFRQYNDEFIGNLVHSAKILDNEGNVKEVERFYFQFGYDFSILQKTHETVLSVIFKLKPGDKQLLWDRAAKESVQKRHDEQPLELPSCGCAFQNIPKADAFRLGTPNFTQSAGYLLDQAGMKGKQVGQAIISKKHANFIVNLGGATAKDVRDLLSMEKKTIKDKFSVDLKEEIVLAGEW